MHNTGLDESQAGIKIAGRNINDLRYPDNTTLMAESKESLDEDEAGLKFNFQKIKTSWQIDGETMETVTGFIFLGSKITVDGDCSHEIKRCLLPGRKAMTNLDSILKKQRHHFASKGSYSQIYDFSSRELDYKEGWELNNWCFWNVVLEKTLESPLDSKEIKPINPKGNQP